MWFKKLRQVRQRKLELIKELLKLEGKVLRAKRHLFKFHITSGKAYCITQSILKHEENIYKLKQELFLGVTND